MGPDVTGAAGIGQENKARLFDGKMLWVRGRWWYKLAHICQRWRSAVLEWMGESTITAGSRRGSVRGLGWDRERLAHFQDPGHLGIHLTC